MRKDLDRPRRKVVGPTRPDTKVTCGLGLPAVSVPGGNLGGVSYASPIRVGSNGQAYASLDRFIKDELALYISRKGEK